MTMRRYHPDEPEYRPHDRGVRGLPMFGEWPTYPPAHAEQDALPLDGTIQGAYAAWLATGNYNPVDDQKARKARTVNNESLLARLKCETDETMNQILRLEQIIAKLGQAIGPIDGSPDDT